MLLWSINERLGKRPGLDLPLPDLDWADEMAALSMPGPADDDPVTSDDELAELFGEP